MKILSLSRKTGVVQIRVDSVEDAYHLSKLIETGDLAAAKTSRKIKLREADQRQKSVKKPVFLKIKVQKIDLDSALRLHGLVEEGPEDIPLHSAHTLDIEAGLVLTLQKENWRDYQIQTLKDAEAASVAPKVLLCVLDDEDASFAFLTSAGTRPVGNLSLRLSKKRFKEQQSPQKDIKRVAHQINEHVKRSKVKTVILGSPLFWKEVVLKQLKEDFPEIAKIIHLEDVAAGSYKGIQELVARGALEKIIKESQLSREFKFVDNLLTEIAKHSKLAIYNPLKIKRAAESSAVETLILTDKYLVSHQNTVTQLIDLVEAAKGKVHIIDSKNDPGKRLDGLQGIGAFLRFAT